MQLGETNLLSPSLTPRVNLSLPDVTWTESSGQALPLSKHTTEPGAGTAADSVLLN